MILTIALGSVILTVITLISLWINIKFSIIHMLHQIG
jgi:hypothetical protein